MDWMNYRLVRKDLTFHHILKREDGGKPIIPNGALLMPVAHQYLHLIEYKDIETYNAIYKLLFKYLYCINGFPFEFLSHLCIFSNSLNKYSIISLCSLVGSYSC